MPISYPLQLRTIIRQGKARSGPAAFAMTEPRRGYGYAEATGTDTPVFWDITLKFTQAEAAVFWQWFTFGIARGVDEFTLPIRTEFGLQTYTVRFLPDSLLPVREDGEVWVYTATIMARSLIVPAPTPDTGWWWDFDDVAPLTTFADRGPAATHLTATPDLATVSVSGGMAGRAADRTTGGTGRLIYVPRSNTALDFGPTDSFSFGLWVYPTALPSDGWTKGIMGRWAAPKDPPGESVTGFDGNVHTSYGLTVLNGVADLYLIQPGAVVREILQGALALNTWQLMVGVVDVAAGEMRLGVDADDFSETAITAGPRNDVSVQGNFCFGHPLHSDATAGMDFAQRQFGGRMDRAFVTRRLLSAEDREWIFNGGAGRTFEQFAAAGLYTP